MQHAIPYRTWVPGPAAVEQRRPPVAGAATSAVSENAVVVFGRRGCCMCHVLRRLFLGHGVNPPVVELDEDRVAAVAEELAKIIGGDKAASIQFPVVFVGGKAFGGLERVMASHISGELVPILKDAGALWL